MKFKFYWSFLTLVDELLKIKFKKSNKKNRNLKGFFIKKKRIIMLKFFFPWYLNFNTSALKFFFCYFSDRLCPVLDDIIPLDSHIAYDMVDVINSVIRTYCSFCFNNLFLYITLTSSNISAMLRYFRHYTIKTILHRINNSHAFFTTWFCFH